MNVARKKYQLVKIGESEVAVHWQYKDKKKIYEMLRMN